MIKPNSNHIASASTGLAAYADPAAEPMRQAIATVRSCLAELETQYTQDYRAVDLMRATLFGLLRKQYQARDRLRLLVKYRRKFLAVLRLSGEEEAAQITDEYENAKTESDSNYEHLGTASARQKILSKDAAAELRSLWKKLVRLYHPDRFTSEPDKLGAHHQLTSAINQARNNGDLQTLREIANDPHGFMLQKGLASLNFRDLNRLDDLRRLFDMLQQKLATTLGALKQLHESPDYELAQLSSVKPDLLDIVVSMQAAAINAETKILGSDATKLAVEINKLAATALSIA